MFLHAFSIEKNSIPWEKCSKAAGPQSPASRSEAEQARLERLKFPLSSASDQLEMVKPEGVMIVFKIFFVFLFFSLGQFSLLMVAFWSQNL